MPRYFVDVSDGPDCVPDVEGAELPDLNAGRRLALRALSEIASETEPSQVGRTIIATVRDEAGQPAYSACLMLTEVNALTSPC